MSSRAFPYHMLTSYNREMMASVRSTMSEMRSSHNISLDVLCTLAENTAAARASSDGLDTISKRIEALRCRHISATADNDGSPDGTPTRIMSDCQSGITNGAEVALVAGSTATIVSRQQGQKAEERIMRIVDIAVLVRHRSGGFVQEAIAMEDTTFSRAPLEIRLNMLQQLQQLRLLAWLLRPPNVLPLLAHGKITPQSASRLLREGHLAWSTVGMICSVMPLAEDTDASLWLQIVKTMYLIRGIGSQVQRTSPKAINF